MRRRLQRNLLDLLSASASNLNVPPVCKCVKSGLLCSPACGCKSDSDICERTVSLENQNEENMSDELKKTLIMNN